MGATIRYKIVEKSRTPLEALELAEDILRLEQILKLLWEVNDRNLSEEIETGKRCGQMMRSMAHLCLRAAQHKLTFFLK